MIGRVHGRGGRLSPSACAGRCGAASRGAGSGVGRVGARRSTFSGCQGPPGSGNGHTRGWCPGRRVRDSLERPVALVARTVAAVHGGRRWGGLLFAVRGGRVPAGAGVSLGRARVARRRRGSAAIRVVAGLAADPGFVHPAQLDSCFQSLAAVFARGDSSVPSVPFSADRIEVSRRIAGRFWCHVRHRGRSDDGASARAAIFLCSTTAESCSLSQRIVFRLVVGGACARPVGQVALLHRYTVAWRSTPCRRRCGRWSESIGCC